MIFNMVSLGIKYNKSIKLNYDKNYVTTYFKNNNKLHKSSQDYSFFKNIEFNKISDDELLNYETYFEKEFKFNEVILDENKNYKINGYFQSYKYFWNNIDKIKKYLFIDNNTISEINETYKSYNKKIIAIHIRLTDYVKFNNVYPSYSEEYYKKILQQYNLENYQIILFSDDFENAKQKLGNLNLNFISANEISENDEYQFYMLCLADIRICCGFTFSLMSCYLNEMYKFKENCEYIFPKKWFESSGPQYDICDIIPQIILILKCLTNVKII